MSEDRLNNYLNDEGNPSGISGTTADSASDKDISPDEYKEGDDFLGYIIEKKLEKDRRLRPFSYFKIFNYFKLATSEIKEYFLLKIVNKEKTVDARIVNEILVLKMLKKKLPLLSFAPKLNKFGELGNKESKRAYLIRTFVEGETLEKYILDEDLYKTLTFEKKLDLSIKILDILKQLHSIGLVYRDLKPENIILNVTQGSIEPVLIDFDLTCCKNCDKSFLIFGCEGRVGTVPYVSPEVLKQNGGIYGEEVDVWAFGMLFHKIFTRYTPVRGDNKDQKIRNIQNGFFDFKLKGELLEIVKLCLEKDSKKRIENLETIESKLESLLKKEKSEQNSTQKKKSQQNITLIDEFEEGDIGQSVEITMIGELSYDRSKISKVLNSDESGRKNPGSETAEEKPYKDLYEENENLKVENKSEEEAREEPIEEEQEDKVAQQPVNKTVAHDTEDEEQNVLVDQAEKENVINVDTDDESDIVVLEIDADSSEEEIQPNVDNERVYDEKEGPSVIIVEDDEAIDDTTDLVKEIENRPDSKKKSRLKVVIFFLLGCYVFLKIGGFDPWNALRNSIITVKEVALVSLEGGTHSIRKGTVEKENFVERSNEVPGNRFPQTDTNPVSNKKVDRENMVEVERKDGNLKKNSENKDNGNEGEIRVFITESKEVERKEPVNNERNLNSDVEREVKSNRHNSRERKGSYAYYDEGDYNEESEFRQAEQLGVDALMEFFLKYGSHKREIKDFLGENADFYVWKYSFLNNDRYLYALKYILGDDYKPATVTIATSDSMPIIKVFFVRENDLIVCTENSVFLFNLEINKLLSGIDINTINKENGVSGRDEISSFAADKGLFNCFLGTKRGFIYQISVKDKITPENTTFLCNTGGEVTCMNLGMYKNKKYLIFGTGTGVLGSVSLQDYTLKKRTRGESEPVVSCVLNGDFLYASYSDGYIYEYFFFQNSHSERCYYDFYKHFFSSVKFLYPVSSEKGRRFFVCDEKGNIYELLVLGKGKGNWDFLNKYKCSGNSPVSFCDYSSLRHFLIGYKNGEIRILKGKELQKLFGHTNAVTFLKEFSLRGRIYLLSASDDGTIRLWDEKRGKEISQLVCFKDGEWAMITQKGFYSCSEGGEKHLVFYVNNKIFSSKYFHRILYRTRVRFLQPED